MYNTLTVTIFIIIYNYVNVICYGGYDIISLITLSENKLFDHARGVKFNVFCLKFKLLCLKLQFVNLQSNPYIYIYIYIYIKVVIHAPALMRQGEDFDSAEIGDLEVGSIIQYSTLQYITLSYSMTQYTTVYNSVVFYYSIVHCSTLQYNYY